MAKPRILETLPDRRRICVMLRADGWSYEEIAAFLDIGVRLVRHELEQVGDALPGVLDHRRAENRNRVLRLVYLMGVSDAGGDPEALTEMLDGLVERAIWLRARMRAREAMIARLAEQRAAFGDDDEHGAA